MRRDVRGEPQRRGLGLGGGHRVVHEADRRRLARADVRPVKMSSFARATPTSGVSRAGPTGTPRRAPAQASLRLSPAIRRSQPATISAPPPTQLPTQTAIVGFGNASSAAKKLREGPHPRTPPAWASSSVMSTPEHSARSDVVENTSTRSVSSIDRRSSASTISDSSSVLERVAAFRPVEAQHHDPVGGHGLLKRSHGRYATRNRRRPRSPATRIRPLTLARRAPRDGGRDEAALSIRLASVLRRAPATLVLALTALLVAAAPVLAHDGGEGL